MVSDVSRCMLELVKCVVPAYADGMQVEAGMAESIKESCKLGVAAYAAQAREQWVLEWPGQVVLAVSAIFWTSAVTNALKNGIPGKQQLLCRVVKLPRRHRFCCSQADC